VLEAGQPVAPMIDREIDRNPHQPGPRVSGLVAAVSSLPEPEECFMRDLLRNIAVQNDEVDSPDHQRIVGAIENLELIAILEAV
jgi:hypothetical protein